MHTKYSLLAAGFVAVWVASCAYGCGGVSSTGGAPDAASDVAADVSMPVESGANEAGADGGSLDATASDSATGFSPAAHRAFPQVPNTGKTMKAPTLVTIVASNDVPTDGTDRVANLQAFGDVLPGSPVWAAVSSEYQLGALSSVAHLTGPPIAAGTYTLDQLVTYVGGVISGDAGAPPNGNTIYLLYLPNGATTGFCAYHTAYPTFATSLGDEMALSERCTPWANTETQLGELTREATAMVVGAATDPLGEGYTLGVPQAQPWNGSVWTAWASGGDVELESLCEGTRVFEEVDGGPTGGWEFQRIYSNAAAAAGNGDPCVPPFGEPYYSVSVPQDWYQVQPGATVTIPVQGWSAAMTSDWLIYPHVSQSNAADSFDDLLDGGVTVSSEAGVGTIGGCFLRWAMNNGTGASVQVTAAPSAVSGEYVVLTMDSFREDSTCYQPITQDDVHFWPVGVYVP